MDWMTEQIDLRVVGTIAVPLALGQTDLIDSILVGGEVHRLA